MHEEVRAWFERIRDKRGLACVRIPWGDIGVGDCPPPAAENVYGEVHHVGPEYVTLQTETVRAGEDVLLPASRLNIRYEWIISFEEPVPPRTGFEELPPDDTPRRA